MAITSMSALVMDTNALLALYTAAFCTPGVMLSVWERDCPAAVDALYAFAHEQYKTVRTRPIREGDHSMDTFAVEASNGATITVYR
jgi:hypothetical protein